MPVGYPGYPPVPNPYQPPATKPRNPYTSGASQNVQDIYKNQTGSWGHNAGNPFGQPIQLIRPEMPTTGGSYEPPKPQNYVLNRPGTTTPLEWSTPAPAPTPMRLETPQTPQDVTPFSGGLVSPPNTPPTNQGPQTGLVPMNTFGFTFEDYQNSPAYKWQLEQGINALENRLAARGLINSSAHYKGIIDYSQGLASTYYDNAYNRFEKDRTFTADRYDSAFDQNMVQKMFDADMWKYMTDKEFENFWKSDASFNTKMAAKAARDAGLAEVGPNSARQAIELTTGTANAIANLSMSLAMFKAMAAQGQGAENAGVIDAIISGITGIIGSMVGGG